MSTLRVDIGPLVGDISIDEEREWLLVGHPRVAAKADDPTAYAGGTTFTRQGLLDITGRASIDGIPETPPDAYLDFTVAGLSDSWRFRMPDHDADLGTLAAQYTPSRGGGGSTPTPTPDHDGVIDGLVLTLDGTDLSATADRTVGPPVHSNTVTLPGGGGDTGLTAVATKTPVSGSGVHDNPVTIGAGAITADRLADGVIPDVSGLATKAELATETSARVTHDGTLQSAINAETTARTKAVSDEASTRGTADTALGGRIDGEQSARESAITDEATARAGADTALGKRIDNEASARGTADDTETAARKAADTALGTRIGTEGVGEGGTSGQILTKKSNTDFDTQWADPSESSVTRKDVFDQTSLINFGGDGLTVTKHAITRELEYTVDKPLTTSNLYELLKSIIEGPSSKVDIAFDDDAETITVTPLDEVIGQDWGNLPVGFAFRLGNIIVRNGFWFICIKPHQKGGTGPDNDSTNWLAITLWTGAYDGKRWYHAGMIAVTSTSLLAVSRIDNSPNTTEPTETSAEWIVLGGERSAGGGAGHWDSFVDATSPATGTDYTITGLRANDIIDLVLQATAADSGSGKVRLTPDSNLVRIDDTTARLQVTPANGASATVTGQYRYIGSDGNAIVQYSFTGDQPAAVTAAAIIPEHANPFVPSVDNIYPTNALIFKGGDNVDLVFNDTDRTIVTNVKLPEYAAPRVYAIDSRDKRTVQPPYSYYQTFTGFTMTPGNEHRVQGEPAIHDYQNKRPGFAIDTLNGQHNSNGVDFTHQTAGTTKRTINVSAEITLANERTYGSEESMILKVYAYGYAKTAPVNDGQVIFTKTFNFHGGFQDAFVVDFPITYSQAPRIGEHDGYRVTLEWRTGTTEVVRGIVDAYKETFTLPALGSLPDQDFTHHAARHVDTLTDWIPDSLKKRVTSDTRIVTWTIDTPDNTGTNAPAEADKADVLARDVTFGASDNKVKDKPFITAAQDSSRVKLSFKGAGQNGAGDVYLCSRNAGFPADVLTNTSAASAWSLDYTLQGALAAQDFYLLDITGDGLGASSAKWDANPGGPKINNVIKGIFHTAALIAGINYTPVRTSKFSLTDADVIEAAEAGLLHVLRIHSDGAIGEIPLRGVPRPVPFGSGDAARVMCGPTWVRGSKGGTATEVVWADVYRDINGLHLEIKGSNGTDDTIYADGAEVEFAKYLDSDIALAIWLAMA